jgi:hypothetical protein
MGGRSSGGNVDTKKSADATMDKLSKGRIGNDSLMGLQEEMAGNQLAAMIPFFSEMMNYGMENFSNNPIFGGSQQPPPMFNFEMPQQPQQPQQPQVAQVAPPGYGGQLPEAQQEMLRQQYGAPSFLGSVNKRIV